MLNAGFLEFCNIASAFVPVDMQTAANDGDWFNMRDYDRCLCVVFKGIGTAGDDPIFTLTQASDNAGTGEKSLTFTTIYQKVGATALSAVGTWTITSQTAANTYTNTASAENEAIICVEVGTPSCALDVANGFTHIQLTIPDVGGNAQIGCGFYIGVNTKYAQRSVISPL